MGNLRQKALDVTKSKLSSNILSKIDNLIWDAGPLSHEGNYYVVDSEPCGAVCAPEEDAMLLYGAVKLLQPKFPLEIGSYIGWTTIHIAKGLKTSKLSTIDSFIECSDSRKIYDMLNDNLCALNVADKVDVYSFAHTPAIYPIVAKNNKFDFVFLDGEHNYKQPMRDIMGLLPYLSEDAVIFMHDTWMIHVREARDYLVDNGWKSHTYNTLSKMQMLYHTKPSYYDKLVAL